MADINEPARRSSSPSELKDLSSRPEEQTAAKLLEGYPPSSGSNLTNPRTTTPFDAGKLTSSNNPAVAELPRFSGLAMNMRGTDANLPDEQEPQNEPNPADNYINIQSKLAANELSEGKFDNNARVLIENELKTAYRLGGLEAEQRFVKRVNERLKDDGSKYRFIHTDSDATNPAKKVYSLVNSDTGETQKLLETDLKDPARRVITPTESITDRVKSGLLNDDTKKEVVHSLAEAYRHGGLIEERKLFEEVNKKLGEVGSNFRLDRDQPTTKSTERRYRVVDSNTGAVKDTLEFSARLTFDDQSLYHSESGLQSLKNLSDRFADGTISLDDRVALENAMKIAEKRDGYEVPDDVLKRLNTKLEESKSDFQITKRALGFSSAYDLLNIKTGDKNQITKFGRVMAEVKPIPSEFIANKLLENPKSRQMSDANMTAIIEDLFKTAFSTGKLEEVGQLLTDINSRLKETNPDLVFEDSGLRGDNEFARVYKLVDKSGKQDDLMAMSFSLNEPKRNP